MTKCPFCRGTSIEPLELEPGKYAYGCMDCGCHGPVEDTEEEAAQAWNQREVDI